MLAPSPSPLARGSSSLIRWFIKKPWLDSLASAERPQVPRSLPMAFHVHTVFSCTPSISRTRTRTRPLRDSIHTHDMSLMPMRSACARFMYSRLCVWICLSHAFCESHE